MLPPICPSVICNRCLISTNPDKSYREKNPVRIRGYGHTYNQKLRAAAIIAYGGYRCSCPCGCDVTEKEYLALDHIDGGGTEHRKQVNHNIYSWLKTNDYPPGFRVLCHNCNMARGFYGYCPREKTSPEVVGELERGRETPSCFAAEAVESVLVATR